MAQLRTRITQATFLSIVLAWLLVSTSCYVVHHEYDGPKQLTPGTKLLRSSTPIASIEGSKIVGFCLFGWIPLADSSGPRLAESLADSAVGRDNYDGITHLHIEDGQHVLGVIVQTLTIGLFGFYSVSVTGDVERFLER